jgi:hypothetical protein
VLLIFLSISKKSLLICLWFKFSKFSLQMLYILLAGESLMLLSRGTWSFGVALQGHLPDLERSLCSVQGSEESFCCWRDLLHGPQQNAWDFWSIPWQHHQECFFHYLCLLQLLLEADLQGMLWFTVALHLDFYLSLVHGIVVIVLKKLWY